MPKRSAPSRTSSTTSSETSREARARTGNERIFVGCDHAAVAAKAVVLDVLRSLGLEVEDLGTDSAQSVDYPDYAAAVAREVSEGRATRGVLLCGTGIGMSIVANKFPGVRAALVHDVTSARLSRQHNDANVLVLGGGLMGERLIRDVVDTWFATEFEGGRHQRRIDKIHALEPKETQQP
jgi:ribose 5-phosphate isomerase B